MRSGGAFLNYILDQLGDLDGLSFQRTLNGIRFFHQETEFGMIQGGKFKLQTTKTCQSSECPTAQVIIRPDGRPTYTVEVPEKVLSNKGKLLNWVRKLLDLN